MKTKTIITAFLLLFSITSFAQTEAETTGWIKEKLEKYGGDQYGNFFDVKVAPCEISFKKKLYSGSHNEYSFNPSATKSWEVGSSKQSIIADSKIIYLYRSDFQGYFDDIEIKNGEADIHERMIKALLHLATFCEEGKHEAF